MQERQRVTFMSRAMTNFISSGYKKKVQITQIRRDIQIYFTYTNHIYYNAEPHILIVNVSYIHIYYLDCIYTIFFLYNTSDG